MIKENTGTNLNGYINELRLNHAIQLLKEHPEYTLRAIAEASGINSMPTFHNLFKSKTGMTPSEFKRFKWRWNNKPLLYSIVGLFFINFRTIFYSRGY